MAKKCFKIQNSYFAYLWTNGLQNRYSGGYRGYSDDKGILNFIEGHLNRKFIQYHSSFKNGYKTGVKHHIKEVSVAGELFMVWC